MAAQAQDRRELGGGGKSHGARDIDTSRHVPSLSRTQAITCTIEVRHPSRILGRRLSGIVEICVFGQANDFKVEGKQEVEARLRYTIFGVASWQYEIPSMYQSL